ncbi:hypothetical protein GCM10027063_48170 [Promicromonospora xylanilytica]
MEMDATHKEKPAAGAGVPLSDDVRRNLGHPSLAGLWTAIRTHLERNSLAVTGVVTANLDYEAADRLNGLVGMSHRGWKPGRRKISLTALDVALRASAAQAGLVSVVADLTGGSLIDRPAARRQQDEARSALWARLDTALARAGLADAPWVAGFVEGVRKSGLLTKAGDTGGRIVNEAGAVLSELARSGALKPNRADGVPVEPSGLTFVELGELATRTTGSAHGLDEGRTTARLVLRAAAAAVGLPVPGTAGERRGLWAMLGVSPDNVSGTVLTWGLRPPGDSLWARSMRLRADAGVVTHLTLQELEAAGLLPGSLAEGAERILVAEPETSVWACENPQVVQAAARAGRASPIVCTSGNPSTAAWRLLARLIDDDVSVHYHGDFDWPGIEIANRLYTLGASPWRMNAEDYDAAIKNAQATERLPLEGAARSTPWDPRLALAMQRHGTAVHEEALIELLLRDMRLGLTHKTGVPNSAHSRKSR